jgi:hypothetical protein
MVERRVTTPSYAMASHELGCKTAVAVVVAAVCSVTAILVKQATSGRYGAIRQKVIIIAVR